MTINILSFTVLIQAFSDRRLQGPSAETFNFDQMRKDLDVQNLPQGDISGSDRQQGTDTTPSGTSASRNVGGNVGDAAGTEKGNGDSDLVRQISTYFSVGKECDQ